MSISKKLMTTGATDDVAYVDDVFSTYLYEGNGGTQAINNGIALGDGLRGGLATYFDGASNIKLNDGVEIVSSSTAYTVSFWIRTEDVEPQRPVALASGVYYQVEKNRLRFYALGTSGSPVGDIMYTCSDITDGLWHHVVHSVTTNSSVMYFDGALAPLYAGSMNGSGSMKGLSSGLAIGGQTAEDAYSSDFTGSLAYVYMDTNYRNLSNESTLRLFINADGSPTSSATLEGLAPQVFFPLADLYNAGSVPDSDFTVGGQPKAVEGCDKFITGEGGMVWQKYRNQSYSHLLFDTERGLRESDSAGWMLSSNTTDKETAADALRSFNSDGFTTMMNAGNEMVSWTFRKAPTFFDVVTYTGSGESGQIINHGLGVAPGMVIVKSITQVGNWYVYHRDLGNTSTLWLNSDTGAQTDSSYLFGSTATDTQFSIPTGSEVDAASNEYVAYFFAHDESDESMIQCGSYTGNGSADGPEIDLGWEPQWVMIKATNVGGDWQALDMMRGITTGGDDPYIRLNDARAEGTTEVLRLTPTGFALNTSWLDVNGSGGEYIYMAIRRPNKPASEFEPEELFAMDDAGNSTEPAFTSGFPVDMAWRRNPTDAASTLLYSRLNSERYLFTDDPIAETVDPNGKFDYPDGWNSATNLPDMSSWMWRRAPGFFDVVAYDGFLSNGELGSKAHNLNTAPEMMIFKNRSSTYSWYVWHKDITAQYYLRLNEYYGETDFGADWVSADADNIDFGFGHFGTSLLGESYIAYLFASVPGISSIGSYTGNGGSQDIDCGFTNGARFVLIKCTSSGELSSNWYVWDSVRGIGSGNDPYICLNNTTAQEVSFDALDTLPAGFTIKQAGPNVNQTGEDYIYMAIA